MKSDSKNRICLACPEASFIDAKGICYKTGGLYCKRHDRIVGKYDPCCEDAPESPEPGGKKKK